MYMLLIKLAVLIFGLGVLIYIVAQAVTELSKADRAIKLKILSIERDIEKLKIKINNNNKVDNNG
jgi:hypothetical protein